MKNLLYKEFRLAINPFFHLIPLLTGCLLLIPQWVYFVAFMYLYWIAIPNILNTYNSQNDLIFSTFMPVKKSDIVKSKIVVIMVMEILNVFVGAIFAIIHNNLFSNINFLMDLNFAFFGFVLIMNGIFNLTLFPMYFKTGYKVGLPIVSACVAVLFYVALLETLVLINGDFRTVVEGDNIIYQLIVLLAGFGLFSLLSYIAYKLSAKRFNFVEL